MLTKDQDALVIKQCLSYEDIDFLFDLWQNSTLQFTDSDGNIRDRISLSTIGHFLVSHWRQDEMQPIIDVILPKLSEHFPNPYINDFRILKYGKGCFIQKHMDSQYKDPAQYQVALMLASGEGVEASDKGAAYWFTQAAENGYDKAIDRLTQPLLTEPNDGSPQVQTKPSRRWNLTLPDNFKKALAPVETRPQRLGIKVQLGAMATKDAAIDLWQLIRDELPEIDQDLPVTVSRHSESGQAEIYRLRVGDFGSVVQARGFCRSIENLSRRPCWVVADHAQ